MGQIYNSSVSVRVWLGEEDNETEMAVAAIRSLADQYVALDPHNLEDSNSRIEHQTAKLHSNRARRLSLPDSHIEAWANLLSRP
jgi:hypothetical protein